MIENLRELAGQLAAMTNNPAPDVEALLGKKRAVAEIWGRRPQGRRIEDAQRQIPDYLKTLETMGDSMSWIVKYRIGFDIGQGRLEDSIARIERLRGASMHLDPILQTELAICKMTKQVLSGEALPTAWAAAFKDLAKLSHDAFDALVFERPTCT